MTVTAGHVKFKVLIMGVGSFAGSHMRALRDAGADVYCYLNRDYGHYPPSLEGKVFDQRQNPNPCQVVRENQIDLVIPQSINWYYADYTQELVQLGVPILSPMGEAMLLERDRDFAGKLCEQYGIPVARAYVAKNHIDAERFVNENPIPYVIKNPLCSPGSPIHTIVCETVIDTQSWIRNVDYAEGAFLQEYMGRREVGHVGFVSGGEIYPMVTNQEYKRAFDGNMGPVAGAPLGGLVEIDPEDKYGLFETMLRPLLPWFRETGFHGPVQVTAVQRDQVWHVIEYNVRTGITTGPALLRMLKNPLEILTAVARNEKLPRAEFWPDRKYACNITLAGWGYPYTKIVGPYLTVQMKQEPTCDVYFNEVIRGEDGRLYMTGHRIADVIALAGTLDQAIKIAYENIAKIYCLSSYYRLDIGKSLWPPGEE